MKAFLPAGFAFVLAALPLQAQVPDDRAAQDEQAVQNSLIQQLLQLATQAATQAATQTQPPAAHPPGGQTGRNPLIQQYLVLATQAVTEIQRQSAQPASVHPTEDQTAQSPLVQQLLRLAIQEITQLQRQLSQGDARDADSAGEASTALPDGSAPASRHNTTAVPDDGTVFSTMGRAWDGMLSTGGLRTGNLRTGSLQTGSLQTGSLQTGRLSETHLGSQAPPPAAMPPADSALPVTAAVNALPVDPDDEMRRWNQRIDRQYATEPAARRAALRLYPELAVARSEFNTQFLARYAQYRQADPFGFLRGPGWPMKLAIFTAGDLQRQKSGGGVSP